MIDCKVALLHHFFEIAITEGIAQIPANAQENNFRVGMTPFEWVLIGFGQEQTSPTKYKLGKSTLFLTTSRPFLQPNPTLSSHYSNQVEIFPLSLSH